MADGGMAMDMSLSGFFETEVFYDFDAKEWKMQLVTGGFKAGGGFGYEWSSNFQVGPVPMFLELGAGIAAEVEFNAAINNVDHVNDYLTQLQVSAYLSAFGGFGFDYAIVALKLGIYGELSLTAQLRWLNAAGRSGAQFGHNVTLAGEVGVKVEATILFISYSKVLWSAGFETSLGKSNNWEHIENYWTEVGAGKSGASTFSIPRGANLLAYDATTGTAILSADQDAALVDRDYLSQYRRSYNSDGPGANGGFSFFNLFSDDTNTSIVKTIENAYSHASPAITDDGQWMFYLDDMGNSTDATVIRVSAAENTSGGGYNATGQAALDDHGYGDSGLNAAGEGNKPVAVWSRVTERPAITEPGQTITPDIQAAMMNSSDIMVAVRSSSGWTVKNLTEDNGFADLSPVVAASGNNVLVAWRQVASSDAADLTNFNARDYIYYRYSSDYGQNWTEAQPIYNGTSGAVKGLEAAMLTDGTAAVAFTLQTDERSSASSEYSQEIAYAVVGKPETSAVEALADGTPAEYQVLRYVQMTDDANLDENPQLAAVKLSNADDADAVFVLGWHSLSSDGGSDIRLVAVDKSGNRVTGFVDSLSNLIQNTGVAVSSNFQFVQNADSLDELSVLWAETVTAENPQDVDQPSHDYLSALRFRVVDDQGTNKISVTSAQRLVEMDDFTAIDNFNSYVEDDGSIYTVMQGTYYDYSKPETFNVGGTSVQVAGDKTSIYTTVGNYTDTLRVDSVIPDYTAIKIGVPVPVQVSVTNMGTQPMGEVTVTLGSVPTSFKAEDSSFVAIAPGETRTLTVFHTVTATDGQIVNPTYTISGKIGSADISSPEETLILNIPDLGIAKSNILVAEEDGKRDLQFTLYNNSDAKLAGSDRKVCFQIYSDAGCTQPIGNSYFTEIQVRTDGNGPLKTIESTDLSQIDEGVYTMRYRFDLGQYIQQTAGDSTTPFADENGEIRDGGVTLYAKAWVQLDDGEMLEFNSGNNVASVTVESLLKKADGEPTTIISTLSGSDAGSAVAVTLQNNSMVQKTTGNVIVTLLDADGNVLEQKQSYTGGESGSDGLIALDTEGRQTVAFQFGQKGAAARVTYSDAILTDDTNVKIKELKLDGVPLVYQEEAKTWRNTGTYAGRTSALLSIVPEDPRATVTVNGTPYEKAILQPLAVGETDILIVVTAADGNNKDTYHLVLSDSVPVTGVTLNKASMELAVGASEQLTATISPANATNKGLTWTSSNSSVATVDSSGNVTAIGAGTATITVTTEDGGKTAICAVTVKTASTDPGKPTDPNRPGTGGGGGSGSSSYAVTVTKPEHGKVTARPSNASNGSTVTLTVTPDSGYVLDTLTVTDSRGNEIKLTPQSGGKYTFTMPNRAVTVKATFASLPGDTEKPCDGGADCPSRSFTDLGGVGTWYHEAVDYALRNNLMNGYGNGLFGPNNNLTRAQLAQILYNREGRPTVTGSSPFTDVVKDAWYSDAITWAAANGIVGGYGNGLFGPNDNITREQLATILWRYSKSPAATNKELHFNDTDEISGYALDAIRWAVENGILNGFGDGRLGPKGLATRAQVAQMLKNFIENQEDNA